MKDFFRKVLRFFWSWGFLKFCLWATTIIVLLYAEEDWRGARAWAATKAKWEARGESFDFYGKFLPPPIPDAENLAAIPLFRLEPYRGDKNDSQPLALEKAMREGVEPDLLPPAIGWNRGEALDREKKRAAIATEYAAAFPGAIPPPNTLGQFEALFPFLPSLRADAATHPSFRLPADYANSPPSCRSLGAMTHCIRLSKILTLHAGLALEDHQSDLALEDMRVNLQIASKINRDPTLVAGLVKMAMIMIGNGAVYEGLARHEWSDANLAELERLLGAIDLLADAQFAFRCEAAESVTNIDYYKHMRMQDIYGLFQAPNDDERAWALLTPPWADGWWDANKCGLADMILAEVAAVDPKTHRAFPDVSRQVEKEVDRRKLHVGALAPWNIYATLAVGPVDSALEKFPAAQVWVDEARIACALERYRLAHGNGPATLEALTPTYLAELPHDVINGEPYRYRLRPDGTFLLYSVGWNQTDDAGKEVVEPGTKRRNDFQGDWVWPTPRITP